jgi:hypothetical protein
MIGLIVRAGLNTVAKRSTAAKPRTTGRRRGGPPHTLWKPGGPSPNPGGRPALFAEVREAAQQQGIASIQKLVDIRDDPKAPLIVQLAAANSLLDRGYGRPLQGVAIQNMPALPDPKKITSTMTEAEAAQAYAETVHSMQLERDGAGRHNDRLLDPPAVIDVTPNNDDGDAS